MELGRTLLFLNVVSGVEETSKQFSKVVGLIHSRGVNRVMPIESKRKREREKKGHSKGLTIKCKEIIFIMSNTELETTMMKLSSISNCAKNDIEFEFTSMAQYLNVSLLAYCYQRLDRNKAIGIDKVSWQKYGLNLEANLTDLVSRLKRKSFRPAPTKRVYIPKGEHSTRPIGISTIENKIVEKGITEILQSIYEEDFLLCSYGFRPEKNAHQALQRIDTSIMSKPVNHIIEADIEGFFDNVSHERLIEFLQIRIKDSSLIFLIKRFLKAGYVDNELLVRNKKGTPQGSILSPLLANIYLHYVLDTWIEQKVKLYIKGYCQLVRYADDFVILVQYKTDADRINQALYKRFTKYDLTLQQAKTRQFSFGRYEKQNSKQQKRKPNTFDFLGFTHFIDKTRKGYFKLGRKTSSKKFRQKCKELNQWLKSIRNLIPTKEWWKILGAKLRGHYQYYGVSGNYPRISKYYQIAIRLVHKWLNRRSQKSRMNWNNLNKYLTHYQLPKPSIRHNFYILSTVCELN